MHFVIFFWGLVHNLCHGNNIERLCLSQRLDFWSRVSALNAANDGSKKDARVSLILLFTETLKSRSCLSLRVLQASCLLAGLELAELPLCCFPVCFKPLSSGCQCSHDLTWPQQKHCLMTCANSNPDLLFNLNLHSNHRPHCRLYPKNKFSLPASLAAGGLIRMDHG